MMKLEKDFIQCCAEFLFKIADFEDYDDKHYISMGHGDGEHLCFKCCEKEVEKINKELPENEEKAFVDGGWNGAGIDGNDEGPDSCDICYKKLDYSLSESGVIQECKFFLEEDLVEITPNNAAELYYLFDNSDNYDFQGNDLNKLTKLANKIWRLLDQTIESRFEILDL